MDLRGFFRGCICWRCMKEKEYEKYSQLTAVILAFAFLITLFCFSVEKIEKKKSISVFNQK